MGSIVNLEDADVAILLEAYQHKKKTLEEEIGLLNQELNRLSQKISLLTSTGIKMSIDSQNVISNPSTIIKYNPEWTWNEKMKYVFIGREHLALSANDIVNGLLALQPELDRNAVMKSISATLSVGADRGLYSKEIKGGSLMHYKLSRN
jgi:hypothetical protein